MAHPVVLIHGMWCTGSNFARLHETLRARGHACHAPNLPHHGAGVDDPAVGDQSLRDYLKFLEAYIKAQNFPQPPIVIGHSMGGLLAQQLAARINPLALVLLTPASPSGIFGIRWANFVSFLFVFLRWGWWRKSQKPSFRSAVANAFNGVPVERHRALYDGLVAESGRAVFEIGFWLLDRQRASAVDASAVRCPVYVVSSGRDRLTPAAVVRKVAARYPQAALRHYPERGHWVLDDVDADDMNLDIANWIQGQELRAAPRKLGASRV